MSLPIPENVIEAFKREFWASCDLSEPEDRSFESGMQAALAEWGATVDDDNGHNSHYRVITAWTAKAPSGESRDGVER